MIFWTLAVTAIILLLTILDPGFLSGYLGGGVLAVSTGERIEMLVPERAPLRAAAANRLHWLKSDGSLESLASFKEPIQCISGFDAGVFITFKDNQSSIFKNGKWTRGVSPPPNFRIRDVAPFQGTIYAVGQAAENSKFELARLGENGWDRLPAVFDAGRTVGLAGFTYVSGGLEVLYASISRDVIGRLDPEKTRFYHVLFDGEKWGEEVPVQLPARTYPVIASYKGSLALLLLPLDKNVPVKLVTVAGASLQTVTEIPVPKDKRILSAMLAGVADEYTAVLVGANSIWDVKLTDAAAAPPRIVIKGSPAARMRSHLYVGLFGLSAVMLVSLGITWLILRIGSLRAAAGGKPDA